MIVKSVEPHDHYFHITFERDGHVARKAVRVGGLDFNDFVSSLIRAEREADRDISMTTHGDLQHCANPSSNRAIHADQ